MSTRTLFTGLLLAALGTAYAQEAVPGELVVRFKPTANVSQITAQLGGTVTNFNNALRLATIKLPNTLSVVSADSIYTANPGVMYAEPNYIYRATWTPNDLSLQQYGPKKIQAPAGWDVHRGSPTTIIAIVDTGVDLTHPDLQGKLVPGYDFVNDDDDPTDDHGHGTHCAGNSAAVTDNGVGIAGIAPGCSIMPIKVLSAGGSGSNAWIADGITFAADNGAQVISLSLGGPGASQALQDAGAYALSKGALPIAASGNNGVTTMFYPAGFDEYLAVAATDQNDLRANFSNYGANWVDVAAPGVNIYATMMGGGYGGMSGTSMACPIVAGVAGVLRSSDTTLTPAQARTRIENACDNVGSFVRWGRVNLARTLTPPIVTAPFTLGPTATSVYEGTYASGNNASVVTSDNVYYRVNAANVLRTGRVAGITVTVNGGNLNTAKVQSMKLAVESAAATGVTLFTYVWDKTLNSGAGGWTYLASSPLPSTDTNTSYTIPFSAAKHFDAGKNVKFLIRAVYPNKANIPAQNFQFKADRVRVTGTVAL